MADESSGIGSGSTTVALTRRPTRPFRQAQQAMDVVVAVLCLAAIPLVMLDVGFDPHQRLAPTSLLRGLQVAISLLLAIDRLARLGLNRPVRPYAQSHWGDYLAMAVAAVLLLLQPETLPRVVADLSPAMAVVQGYLVVVLLLQGLRLAAGLLSLAGHPARMVALSFLILILIGSALLMLPRATPPGYRPAYFIDALFTSTSAACVTGLIVRDTGSEFSRFGQTVILGLIQLGGLGIMIFGSVFVMLTRRSLGMKQAAAMSEMLSQENYGQIARLVRFIVSTTLFAELAGALLLWPMFDGAGGGFAAVFHSISAFCNAGFALQADSFIGYRTTWQVMLLVPGLIIVGGLGFPVLQDIVTWIQSTVRTQINRALRRPRGPRARLMLHSKLTLLTTAALLVVGAIALLGMENLARPGDRVGQPSLGSGTIRANDWQRTEGFDRLGQAWFTSVTARTAGFNTIDMDDLSPAGKLWVCGLMFVGGSPASTAGGIKTVTFAVLVMLVISMLRRRHDVEVHKRTIAAEIVRRAATLAILYLSLVAGTTLALCITQHSPTVRFIDVMFEAFSACGTVGLSLGETANLTEPSKVVIILAMFAGRVGPLTLLVGLMARLRTARYSYPSESVIIG